MVDGEHDLVLRDPEGGILMRWLFDEAGWPCLGNGVIVGPADLWGNIVNGVTQDRDARKEQP